MSILAKDNDLIPTWVVYQNSDAFVEDICIELKSANKTNIDPRVQIAIIINDPVLKKARIVFEIVTLNRYDIGCYDYESTARLVKHRLLQKYPDQEIILESTKLRFRKQ